MTMTATVKFGDSAGDTATLLLAAAEELELPADVVTTNSDSEFQVPVEVAQKAGVDYESDDEESDEPKPAKKTAKKTAAKKTAAKKTAKKSAKKTAK